MYIFLIFFILVLYLLSLLDVIEKFKTFIKTQGRKDINIYTGLNRYDTYKLETMCLKSLKKNFKCDCKKKRIHFPEIKKTYKRDKKFVIEMNHLGKSISSLTGKDIKQLRRKNLDLDEQVQCILSNLKRAKVYHGDMHLSGKNMIFNKKSGDLGLIDFDISNIKNFVTKNNTDKLRKKTFNKNIQKQNTKEEFYKILKKKKTN